MKIETRTDGIIRLKEPKRHRNWEKIRRFLEEVEVFIRSVKLKNNSKISKICLNNNVIYFTFTHCLQPTQISVRIF